VFCSTGKNAKLQVAHLSQPHLQRSHADYVTHLGGGEIVAADTKRKDARPANSPPTQLMVPYPG
jgi:hypothetical protein